jgi:DNA-binding transcriptional LysR family regulator
MAHDLNLLRTFDILYDELSVIRAAARLFLTQSAVSHALARLRRLRVALAEIRSVVATPISTRPRASSASLFRAALLLRADRSQPDRARTQIYAGHDPADRQH